MLSIYGYLLLIYLNNYYLLILIVGFIYRNVNESPRRDYLVIFV